MDHWEPELNPNQVTGDRMDVKRLIKHKWQQK